jgi:hypothetical protein
MTTGTSAAVHVNVWRTMLQTVQLPLGCGGVAVVNVPITFTVTATDDRLLTKLD